MKGPLNPLLGPVLAAPFDTRFVPLSKAYSFSLRKEAFRAAHGLGFPRETLAEGTYAWVSGPTYETPAEGRFLRAAGADVVGMSTIPEVVSVFNRYATCSHGVNPMSISTCRLFRLLLARLEWKSLYFHWLQILSSFPKNISPLAKSLNQRLVSRPDALIYNSMAERLKSAARWDARCRGTTSGGLTY